MGGAQRIYLEEVAGLLLAGLSFEQACLRLKVDEDSVITNLRRAERRGQVGQESRVIRGARQRLARDRYNAAMARRRDVTIGIQSR